MNPVATYCKAFEASKLEPIPFAQHMLARDPELCRKVLEHVGCWPSSEPELRALQRLA